jgi:mRNA-degrading endonuclease RelE of RelBE toxin-antitoxin system
LAWKIDFEQNAIRQLNRLDKSVRHRTVEYLELLPGCERRPS